MIERLINERVFAVRSSDRLFNPYNDVDPEFDLPDADEIRRANLLAYLDACSSRPDLLLIAEAPGPHGCRFSGVPFASEEQLVSGVFPFKGNQSSLAPTPYSEYSARIVWGLLAEHFSRVVIWNTVPMHPHKLGEPMSIRTPSTAEVREWSALIPRIVEHFEPKTIGAVGRIAERACGYQGIECVYVRHPSQGGANLFREMVGASLRSAAISAQRSEIRPSEAVSARTHLL